MLKPGPARATGPRTEPVGRVHSYLNSLMIRGTNRQAALDGEIFDPANDFHTLRGTRGIVHYGVMIPGLPEPFRFFDLIVVLGSPRLPLFGNPKLLATTPRDAAWALIGTSAIADGFHHYSVERDCEVGADDSYLRLGNDAALARDGNEVTVHASQGDVTIDLALTLSPAVTHFVRVPRVYDHLSVLASYEGRFNDGATTQNLSGLCTYEYARSVNAPFPFAHYFTYHVLNISETTQVLMVDAIGSGNLAIQRTVYVRETSGTSVRYSRGFRHTVHAYAEQRLRTPDGFEMKMPHSFSWGVLDEDGREVISIEGTCNGDFRYGMAAGYAGSYEYVGTFRGQPIEGTAYEEWILRRG